MELVLASTARQAGAFAAAQVADAIRSAIAHRGQARITLGTGASQIVLLEHLVASEGIDWSVVTMFHLDQYIAMAPDHPASFIRYLRERFVEKVPSLAAAHFIDGLADPRAECRRVGTLIRESPVDVSCVGIGENGHLAFNDPPADFETAEPYLEVELDDACRRQQFGEGWFPTFDAVPRRAISMSVRQILASRKLVCTVPDLRKARPARDAIEGPLTNRVPASILRTHENCIMIMDEPAASLLSDATKAAARRIE